MRKGRNFRIVRNSRAVQIIFDKEMDNGNNTFNDNNGQGNDRRKTVNFKFNFSWIYMLLMLVIVWMFFNQGGGP